MYDIYTYKCVRTRNRGQNTHILEATQCNRLIVYKMFSDVSISLYNFARKEEISAHFLSMAEQISANERRGNRVTSYLIGKNYT